MRAGGQGGNPQSESSAGTHAPRPRHRPHIESPGQGTSLRNGGQRHLPRRQQGKTMVSSGSDVTTDKSGFRHLPEVADGGRCIPRLEGEVTPVPPPPWAVRLGTCHGSGM